MDTTTRGWINGFIGVLIFAGSLPATRVAVADIDPTLLTAARASIAALIAAAMLLALRQPRPPRTAVASLLVVALGVVVGFRCSPRWPCSMCPRRTRSCSWACCR